MGLGEGARCSALGRLDEEGEGRDLVLEGVVRGVVRGVVSVVERGGTVTVAVLPGTRCRLGSIERWSHVYGRWRRRRTRVT